MTIFSAAASRDLLIIVAASIGAAIAVNLPGIVALFALWVAS
jgi:hypothetical protein